MPLLVAILQKDDFDPEAKLMSIIAFGDLTLASGPDNFMHYLDETKKSFFAASTLSLSLGSTPEEQDLLHRLRIALCESYLSILHGLHDEERSTI